MITTYLISATEKQLAVLKLIEDLNKKADECHREIEWSYRLDHMHPARRLIPSLQHEERIHQAAVIRLQEYYANLVQRMVTAIEEKEIGYPVNVRIGEGEIA
jgi:hypothetical protein